MAQVDQSGVPSHYRQLKLDGGFITGNGPVFWCEEADGVAFGMRLEDRHCNLVGICHGGWTATFMDIVLPLTGRFTVPELELHALLTINLSIDYLDAARSGDWLEGRATVLRKTGRMIFLQGMLLVGERPIARGSGIFRIGPEVPPAR